jgi:ABC-type bacteriocin/lantibiotic exporter with double-glycine peptidase domain
VLLEVHPHRVRIADPAQGVRWVSQQELTDQCTGYVLELIPQGAPPRHPYPSTLERLRPLIQQAGGALLSLLVLSLGYDLVGLIAPVLTQRVVDEALPQGSPSLLLLLVGGIGAAGLGQLVLEAVRSWVVLHASNRLDHQLLCGLYEHLLRLPVHLLERRSLGDLLSRFGDAAGVRGLVTGTLVGAVLDAGLTFIYLGLMFAYHKSLTLTLLCFVPLFALLSLGAAPLLRKQHRGWSLESAAAEATLTESLGGARTVRSLGVEHQALERFRAQHLRALHAARRVAHTRIGVDASSAVLYRSAALVLLYQGMGCCMRGELTLGQYMAFNVLLGSVMEPITRLLSLWEELQHSLVSLERYAELTDTSTEARGALVAPDTATLAIRAGRVAFGNPAEPAVLRGLSLALSAGERVAVVGPSGGGKSTLLRVLLGLTPLQAGEVTLDGKPLAAYDLPRWRATLGVVLQDGVVFSGTLRSNLLTASPQHEADFLWEALRIACLDDFVRSLPQGLETRIGERGTRLSGGQVQRLALARALARQPRLLLLDEPTSQLDDTTAEAVLSGLLAYAERTAATLVMVTHKLPSSTRFTRVLQVEDGQVHEHPTSAPSTRERNLHHALSNPGTAEP